MPAPMRRNADHEQRLGLDDYSKALINILEDSAAEKFGLQEAQRAVLNILEDSAAERSGLQEAQKAVLNILDDLAGEMDERKRFEHTLQEKNVELENAILSKDRFLASMSHELRTPLNAIIGFTGTLLMKLPGPLNAGQEKQLSTVQTSSRHLLSLINDLLDLARIGSGKVVLQPVPVACKTLLDEVSATLRPQSEAKGLAFETRSPPGEPMVNTDCRALSQILINLTNNAIKFTHRGKVTIELTQQRENGVLCTRFSVLDTGIGIRMEDQTRLFQAFEQLRASGAPRHEGAGLGLHLSKELATLLGGRIEFESEAGKGSRFTLVLEER